MKLLDIGTKLSCAMKLGPMKLGQWIIILNQGWELWPSYLVPMKIGALILDFFLHLLWNLKIYSKFKSEYWLPVACPMWHHILLARWYQLLLGNSKKFYDLKDSNYRMITLVSHMKNFAIQVDIVADECNSGKCTLLLTGYIRAHGLSVNQLVASLVLLICI